MSRYLGAIKTHTVQLPNRPEAVFRYLGHGAITRFVCAHPGLDIVIEDVIGSLMKLPSVKSALSKGGKVEASQMAAAIMNDLQGSAISPGRMAALAVVRLPDLVFALLIESAVLQPDETQDQFADWLDGLDAIEIATLLLEWYRFNFVGGIGAFLKGLFGMFGKKNLEDAAGAATTAAPVAKRPARTAIGRRR